jgi:hypothetical protein
LPFRTEDGVTFLLVPLFVLSSTLIAQLSGVGFLRTNERVSGLTPWPLCGARSDALPTCVAGWLPGSTVVLTYSRTSRTARKPLTSKGGRIGHGRLSALWTLGGVVVWPDQPTSPDQPTTPHRFHFLGYFWDTLSPALVYLSPLSRHEQRFRRYGAICTCPTRRRRSAPADPSSEHSPSKHSAPAHALLGPLRPRDQPSCPAANTSYSSTACTCR